MLTTDEVDEQRRTNASYGAPPVSNQLNLQSSGRGPSRRDRIRWSCIFLILWGAIFAVSFLLIASVGTVLLLLVSFIDAVLLLVVIYGLSGIRRKDAFHRTFAIVLILLLLGFAYQNSSYITGTVSLKDALAQQASYANSVMSAIVKSLPTSLPSVPGSGHNDGGGGGAGSSGQSSVLSEDSQVANPLITNAGDANVTYPANYQTLANFALGLINNNRAADGLPPVTLSNFPSAQQHADSMLYYDYFSHWDTQGYKPYMRYSLLGGAGAIDENIGLDACTNSPGNATVLSVATCNIRTVENGINNSEWGMMYNDASCCNNGHRNNILDPLHNQVSIGIAYNTTSSAVYFVEDFLNDYIALTSPISTPNGTTVTILGSLSSSQNITTVAIYYDPLPQPMTTSQLDATSSYGPGTFVGGVFAPCTTACPYYPGAVTEYASEWQVNSSSVSIEFSLSSFESTDGPGVYTMYVQTGTGTADSILTHSIFVSS